MDGEFGISRCKQLYYIEWINRFGDGSKTVLRWKFIALNSYIKKKKERSKSMASAVTLKN